MLCLLAKTVCGRTQLTIPLADPEEGAGVWKITNSIGLYRIMQLDPSHCLKGGPPGNVGPSFSMGYRKVIINDSLL